MNVQFRAFAPCDVQTLRSKLPFSMSDSTIGIVAYDKDTAETLAICVGSDWTKTSFFVHQVIFHTMVLRHGWLEECFDYAFSRAGRIKMFAAVPSNNAKALRLNSKMGFKQVAVLKDAHEVGVDYVIMELKREDCPYWVQPALQKVS